MGEPIRIANCSGFFGDRLSAARENASQTAVQKKIAPSTMNKMMFRFAFGGMLFTMNARIHTSQTKAGMNGRMYQSCHVWDIRVAMRGLRRPRRPLPAGTISLGAISSGTAIARGAAGLPLCGSFASRK